MVRHGPAPALKSDSSDTGCLAAVAQTAPSWQVLPPGQPRNGDGSVSAGYGFGDCELWPAQRLLLRQQRVLALGGRAFDLLQVLVEHSHRLMHKDELLELVWPGLAVEPNNLQVQVWSLRQLLGAGAISTVPRRGYRFMLPVQPLAAPLEPVDGAGVAAVADPGWHAWAAPLQSLPLLTLLGPDPLALRPVAEALAQLRRGARPAGLWRIDARTLGSASRVKAVPGADDPLWPRLARQQGQLLLLDCQHAMPAARALVRAARCAAPDLQLLTTAAVPLGLPGEVLAQPPLPAVTEPTSPGGGTGLRWQPRPGAGVR